MSRAADPLCGRARSLLTALLILVGVSAACSVSHTMTPEPATGSCPPVTGADGGQISWYGPAQSRDRRILAEWCVTVGPPVIDSVPAMRFPPWRHGDSLAVITWNVHVGGGDIPALLEGELGFDCGEQPDSPGPGSPHFVLLLQEAYRRSEQVPALPPQSTIPKKIVPDERPAGGPDVVGVARECGLSLVYIPSMRNGHEEYDGGREDRGNAILSTLGLSDFIAIEIPFEASRKVAVGATVHAAGGDSLRAVSAHLDVSSTLFRTVTTGNSTRLRQSLGLAEALDVVEEARGNVSAGHPIATVLAGDFNAWSADETAIRDTRKNFPQSPASNGIPTRGAFPADFIFFRESNDGKIVLIEGSYRRAEAKYSSDHYSLIAWFRAAG